MLPTTLLGGAGGNGKRHQSHRVSESNFDALKTLQAEVAKTQSLDGHNLTPRLTRTASIAHKLSTARSHLLQFTAATFLSYRAGVKRPRLSDAVVPTAWNPLFLDKPACYKRFLIKHPDLFPVCTLHLAAIVIQRWWRAMPRDRRLMRSRRRLEQLPSWEHPWEKLKRIDMNALVAAARAKHKQQHGVAAGTTMAISGLNSFADHCARVIQREWRAHRERRHRVYVKRRMYRIATRSIQRWWRQAMELRQRRHSRKGSAALVIQRAFRSHADRRVYHFFRDLIRSRQTTDPALLLKALQPREASLTDPSSGLYIRLRLGGSSFPPLILYKVFTAQHVLDIGAFAPRHYAADQKRADGGTDVSAWYRREDHNGWRVVGGAALLIEEDEGIPQRSPPSYHHPNKEVRRIDRERRRKERRVQWMTKMYRRGREQEAEAAARQQRQDGATDVLHVYDVAMRIDELIGRSRVDDGWDEGGVDELVDWAADLDFDAYQQQWSSAGVTAPALRP